ncbi:MAG: diguanylate cyclase [Candidatus Rhabdochlamydia sp.]
MKTLPLVLIVSEKKSLLTSLEETLTLDCKLLYASDVTRAASLLKEHLVDIVLFDAATKEDLVLFKELRDLSGQMAAPLLLLTHQFSLPFIQKALDSGATDFILAPFSQQLLEQRMVMALQHLWIKSLPSHPLSIQDVSLEKQDGGDERRNAGDISLLTLEIDVSQNLTPPSEDDLVQLMVALQSNLRKHDILLPQPGNNFILMLPKTSSHTAQLVAEAIRLEIDKQTLPFSISIDLIPWTHSCATCESAAEEFDHLVEVANQVVLDMKHQQQLLLTASTP